MESVTPLSYREICKNFKFHSNLDLRKTLLRKFPKLCYINEMLYKWGTFLSSPNSPSAIISQFIWFSKKIQIDKMHVFFLKFVR